MLVHPRAVATALLFSCCSSLAFAGELSVGGVAFQYRAATGERTPIRLAAELAYHDEMPVLPLRLGLGFRAGSPSGGVVPMEGYGQLQFQTGLGSWKPLAGIELGYSGFPGLHAHQTAPAAGPDPSEKIGGGYGAASVDPLRFVMGSVVISALALHAGTTLTGFGETGRFQLGLVRIGGRL